MRFLPDPVPSLLTSLDTTSFTSPLSSLATHPPASHTSSLSVRSPISSTLRPRSTETSPSKPFSPIESSSVTIWIGSAGSKRS
jgi:hypothetical protein